MRAAADSPITTRVATIAITGSLVVEVIVVDSWMITNGSGTPALVGKGKTDSPAASTMW